MNIKNILLFITFIAIILSCNIKSENSLDQNNIAQDYSVEFNKNTPEMIYSIEYYKNEIIEFQKIIPERRRINYIEKIDNIIPGSLCFLVGWDDFNAGRGEGFDIIANESPRGNIFGIYSFDNNQNIANEYQVGYKNYIDSIKSILFKNLPANSPEHGLILCGDYNNDGINEIISIYLYPPLYEYVFTVFGYNFIENNFIPLLIVPVYIHFEEPYPPVEYIENGFKILEIIENEPLELSWNYYIWDTHSGKYIRKIL